MIRYPTLHASEIKTIIYIYISYKTDGIKYIYNGLKQNPVNKAIFPYHIVEHSK